MAKTKLSGHALALRLERDTMRDKCFTRWYNELRNMGIEVKKHPMGLIGMYKNHPFAVFMRFTAKPGAGRIEQAGMVVTRYRGQDVPAKPPTEVLKRGV